VSKYFLWPVRSSYTAKKHCSYSNGAFILFISRDGLQSAYLYLSVCVYMYNVSRTGPVWFVFLHPFPFAQPPHTTRARPSSFRTTEHDNTPLRNVTRAGAKHHGSCSPQPLKSNGRYALLELRAPNVTTPTRRLPSNLNMWEESIRPQKPQQF